MVPVFFLRTRQDNHALFFLVLDGQAANQRVTPFFLLGGQAAYREVFLLFFSFSGKLQNQMFIPCFFLLSADKLQNQRG